MIEAFFTFAQAEQQREAEELIHAENLNADAELNALLPVGGQI
jgi:type I restriction enzyme R subunit